MVWDGKTENLRGAVSSAYHSGSQAPIFSDLHLFRAQSCSLAYLAGSPEIIANYSLEVSDKTCWCSARILDSQICCDWGHICECYTISCLCCFEQASVFWTSKDWNLEGLIFLKHLEGWVLLISVLSWLMGRTEYWRSLWSSATVSVVGFAS